MSKIYEEIYNKLLSVMQLIKKAKELLRRFELIGDKGYRHSEYVKVCESKEEKAQRQVVEGVFSWLKRFNPLSGWRKGITLLTYLYAYALGYSFFRKREVLTCA